MESCIFCKIVKGEIPSYKVYEDENFLAFLGIPPVNKGHTLVIPKKHYRWVWDVENIGEYYEVIQKIVKGIQKAMNTEWVVSAIAGEEAPHAHVWLVPRYENDGHGGFLDTSKKLDIPDEEMKEITKKIKQNI